MNRFTGRHQSLRSSVPRTRGDEPTPRFPLTGSATLSGRRARQWKTWSASRSWFCRDRNRRCHPLFVFRRVVFSPSRATRAFSPILRSATVPSTNTVSPRSIASMRRAISASHAGCRGGCGSILRLSNPIISARSLMDNLSALLIRSMVIGDIGFPPCICWTVKCRVTTLLHSPIFVYALLGRTLIAKRRASIAIAITLNCSVISHSHLAQTPDDCYSLSGDIQP